MGGRRIQMRERRKEFEGRHKDRRRRGGSEKEGERAWMKKAKDKENRRGEESKQTC